MRKLIVVVLWVALLSASKVFADCTGSTGKNAEAFPCAKFYGEFRKRLHNDPSQNFFAWDARLDLDGIGWRKGKNSVQYRIDFQTVGARSIGPKVNLAGTSYILEARFAREFRNDLDVSVGTTHLSSHLAKDLDALRKHIKDPNPLPALPTEDVNTLFAGVQKRFLFRFPIRVLLRVQPVEFRYRGGLQRGKNPLFAKTRTDIAGWNQERIFFATEHLAGGSEGFNYFESGIDLFPHGQAEGRVQIFFGYAPGKDIIAIPAEGWRHEGFSAGVRLVFHAQ